MERALPAVFSLRLGLCQGPLTFLEQKLMLFLLWKRKLFNRKIVGAHHNLQGPRYEFRGFGVRLF